LNRFFAADGFLLGVDASGDIDIIFRKELLRSSTGGSTLAVIRPGNRLHIPKLTWALHLR
jgi:hypothetical protein